MRAGSHAGGGAPAISIVIPVHADADALPVTWPAIRGAAARLGGAAEMVAVVTPSGDRSGQILAALAPPGRCRIVDLPVRGKFRALRAGVEATKAPVLVLVDADVQPEEDALARLVEPIHRGEADVCLPRRLVAPGPVAGPAARLLQHWSTLWAEAWHRVRLEQGFAWCLSGTLYAMRRALFPPEAAVPVLDDLSIGHAARAGGARFRYVPEARVWFRSPLTPADWVRQKLRTRRGFVRFGRLDPEVALLQAALLRAVRGGPGGRSLAARSLVWQERLVRRAARLLEPAGAPATEAWPPVPSTKRWTGPPA